MSGPSRDACYSALTVAPLQSVVSGAVPCLPVVIGACPLQSRVLSDLSPDSRLITTDRHFTKTRLVLVGRAMPGAAAAGPASPSSMTDEELIDMPLKKLVTLMKKANYSEGQMTSLKSRRRKLQNRNSAKTSAARKQTKYSTVMTSYEKLQRKTRKLEEQNAELEAAYADVLKKAEKTKILAATVAEENKVQRREIELLTALLEEHESAAEIAPEETVAQLDSSNS